MRAANLAAEFPPQAFKLLLILLQIERLLTALQRHTFFAREVDEADARVAIAIFLAAGDGAGQTLLAVKAEPRGENHLLTGATLQRAPERLLYGFAAAGGPYHLLATGAARLTAHQVHQPFGSFDFDFRKAVVSRQRNGREKLVLGTYGFIEFVGERGRAQVQVTEHPLPPALRIVPEVGHEHAGGEVGELAPFGGVVIAPFAPREHGQARRVGSQAERLDRLHATTQIVRLLFARMFDRRHGVDGLGHGRSSY